MLGMRCSRIDSQGQDKAEDIRTLVTGGDKDFQRVLTCQISFGFTGTWICRGFRKRFEDIHKRVAALLEKIITEREVERKEEMTIGNGTNSSEVKDFLDTMLDMMENKNAEIEASRKHIKALIVQAQMQQKLEWNGHWQSSPIINRCF